MVQRKHKKRKQHTKVKSEAPAQESVQQEDSKPKAALFSKKDDAQGDKPAKKERSKKERKGKDGKAAKPSLWTRLVDYCKSVKAEMQRVVWPTRSELVNASLIVIGAIVFFGVLIAIIDNVVVVPLDWISTLGA